MNAKVGNNNKNYEQAGDMNAKVGNNNKNYEQVMGKQGIGTRNENGS